MAKRIEVEVDVNTKGAVKDVDKLNNSFEDLSESAEDSSESLSNVEEGLDGLGGGFSSALQGVKGLLSGFKALIANPIGLTIAAIAAVVTTLFKAFSRTEEGSNKLNKGLNFLKAGLSSFFKVIEPIANFIADVFVSGLEEAGKAMDNFLLGLESTLDAIGLGDAADGVREFADEAGKTADKVAELSDLEAKLLKTRREQRLIEKQALIDAENARQIRDDESKTMQERIEANEELGRILKKQGKDELAIANDALRVANLRLEIDGKTTENLDALAEAELEILDIQERINGFESEQLTNINALNREQADHHTEYMDRQREKLGILEEIEAKELAELDEDGEFDFDTEEDDTLAESEEQKAAREQIEADNVAALEKSVEDEAAAAKAKDDIKQNSLNNAIGISKSLAVIFEDNKAIQVAAIGVETAVGAASIIQNTLIANAKAVAALPVTGGQPFVGINTAAAALGIAANVTAASRAISQIGGAAPSGVSGAGGGVPSGAAAAPTINQETLFPTETLEGAESEDVGTGGGLNQQPLRAVVLESDITNTQNTINNLKQRSEIG